MLKSLAADKLPHYRGRRYGGYLCRSEDLHVGKERYQTPRFFVCGRRLGDSAKQRLRIIFQQRKVIQCRRIEHHIGILLIREDIRHLSPADARGDEWRLIYREGPQGMSIYRMLGEDYVQDGEYYVAFSVVDQRQRLHMHVRIKTVMTEIVIHFKRLGIRNELIGERVRDT